MTTGGLMTEAITMEFDQFVTEATLVLVIGVGTALAVIIPLFGFRNRRMKTYIEFNNMNSTYNNGYVYVFVDGEMKEHISVDKYLESDEGKDMYCAEEIIDRKKAQYNISEVIRKEHDWR